MIYVAPPAATPSRFGCASFLGGQTSSAQRNKSIQKFNRVIDKLRGRGVRLSYALRRVTASERSEERNTNREGEAPGHATEICFFPVDEKSIFYLDNCLMRIIWRLI